MAINNILKSKVRHQLYWYIKSICLDVYIRRCIKANALTSQERNLLQNIVNNVNMLKANYIKNSNLVGIKAVKRCSVINDDNFCKCNNKAAYRFKHPNYNIDEALMCKKHFNEIYKTYSEKGLGVKDKEYYKLKEETHGK